MENHTYAFADSQQAQEWERLRAVQAVFDPFTCNNLERLGVGEGWVCLEVGPGAGSIMMWLCDRVGDRGQVVAVDKDSRFVAHLHRSNLEIRQQDITTAPLASNYFDLIHVRFVLMHIPDRLTAFANLVQALKPGGWLLVEEPDFTTNLPADSTGEQTDAFIQIFAATRRFFETIDADPCFGRKLPLVFQQFNLTDVATSLNAALMPGGSTRAKIWRMAVEHLRTQLLATDIPTEADYDRFLALTQDPTVWSMDYTTVAAWGRKAIEA